MQEEIFKPKYPSRLYLVLLFMVPLEIFMLREIFLNNNRSLEMILGAVFFAGVILFLPFVFIKRIRLEKQSFLVETYLRPAKTISYSEVTELGFTGIKTEQGTIPTQFMTNAKELRNLLQKRMEKRK